MSREPDLIISIKSIDGFREQFGDAELTEREGLALAQFLKRVGWNEIRINAIDDGDAGWMRQSLEKLQRALAGAGYSPR